MNVVLDSNVLVAAVAARGTCSELLEHVLTHHSLAIDDNVIDDNIGPLFGQAQGNSSTKTILAARACDQSYFSVQIIHITNL